MPLIEPFTDVMNPIFVEIGNLARESKGTVGILALPTLADEVSAVMLVGCSPGFIKGVGIALCTHSLRQAEVPFGATGGQTLLLLNALVKYLRIMPRRIVIREERDWNWSI